MLPKPEQKVIEIADLAGVNVESGVLRRPVNTFRRLENFDLRLRGQIRKVGGIGLIATPQLSIGNDVVVAMVDYRRRAGEPLVVIGYTLEGHIVRVDNYQLLALFVGEGGIVPFIGQMHVSKCSDGKEGDVLVIACGNNGPLVVEVAPNPPGDSSVAYVYHLGVAKPDTGWPTLYRYSLIVAQVLFTSNPRYGIQFTGGRKYSWTYYNPTTGEESTLAPVHQGTFYSPLLKKDIINPGEVEFDTQIVKEICLIFNGDDGLTMLPYPSRGQQLAPSFEQRFTHVRFYCTPNGRPEFYLMPRLYDIEGVNVLDNNFAFPIADIVGQSSLPMSGPTPTRFYDGYASCATDGMVVDDTSPTAVGSTTIRVRFPPETQYPSSVDINIPLAVDGVNPLYNYVEPVSKRLAFGTIRHHGRDKFTIGTDPTIYAVQAVNATGDQFVRELEITPPLQQAISNPQTGAVPGNVPIIWQQKLPVDDSELIQPAPGIDPFTTNSPPPEAVIGAIYQNRLWLVPKSKPNTIRFSLAGKFGSFPANNEFVFESDNNDPITALDIGNQVGQITEGNAQRMVVGKRRSCSQIRGTGTVIQRDGFPFEDFSITPLFKTTGIIGSRAVNSVSGTMIALTQQGLEILDEQRPIFIGRSIQPLFKPFYEASGPEQFARGLISQVLASTQHGFMLVLYNDERNQTQLFANKILLISDLPRLAAEQVSIFSTVGNLLGVDNRPLYFSCLHETFINGRSEILLAGSDKRVYYLFKGSRRGVADGSSPVVAIAETQELPQDDKGTTKVFLYLRCDGSSIRFEDQIGNEAPDVLTGLDPGWKVAYSVDGGHTFTEDKPLYNDNHIGLVGKTLIIRFTHNALQPTAFETWVTLSTFQVRYTVIGDSR